MSAHSFGDNPAGAACDQILVNLVPHRHVGAKETVAHPIERLGDGRRRRALRKDRHHPIPRQRGAAAPIGDLDAFFDFDRFSGAEQGALAAGIFAHRGGQALDVIERCKRRVEHGQALRRRFPDLRHRLDAARHGRVPLRLHRAVTLALRPRDHLVGFLAQFVDCFDRVLGFPGQAVVLEITELRQHRPARGKRLLHLLTARLDGVMRRRGDGGIVVECGVGETAFERQPFNSDKQRVGGGVDLDGLLRGAEVLPLGIGAGGRERHEQQTEQAAQNGEKKADRIAPVALPDTRPCPTARFAK